MLNGSSWGGETLAAVPVGRAYNGPANTLGDRERELDSLHNRLRELNTRLDDIAVRIRGEADALFGTVPDGANGNKPMPPSPSRLASLHETVALAHEIVGVIESQVGRFASL